MLGNSIVVIPHSVVLRAWVAFLAFLVLFGCSNYHNLGPTRIDYTSFSESDPIVTVSVLLHHPKQETAVRNLIVQVLEKFPNGFVGNVYGHSVERMLVSHGGKSVKLELRPLGNDEYSQLTETEKVERELFIILRDQLLKVPMAVRRAAA